MIIRSQDKKKIFNLEQIRKIDCETNSVRADDVSVMGTYSTEEKAIKVLDMICNFANEKHYEKIVTEQCGCIGGVVFDMPQDSEV